MSYEIEDLRKELSSNGVADKDLVAVLQGDNGGEFSGRSLFAEKNATKFSVSLAGDKLLIIPFNYEKLVYEKGVAFDKTIIGAAKVTGDGVFLLSKLKIWTKDQKLHTYLILQGRKEVKQILEILGVQPPQKKKLEVC